MSPCYGGLKCNNKKEKDEMADVVQDSWLLCLGIWCLCLIVGKARVLLSEGLDLPQNHNLAHMNVWIRF